MNNENLKLAQIAAHSLAQGAKKRWMVADRFRVAGAIDDGGAPVIEITGNKEDLLSIAASLPKSVDVLGKPGETSVIPILLKPTKP